MFHWKGGVFGGLLSVAGFVLNHADAIGSFGKVGGVLVLAAGVIISMKSEPVGKVKE